MWVFEHDCFKHAARCLLRAQHRHARGRYLKRLCAWFDVLLCVCYCKHRLANCSRNPNCFWVLISWQYESIKSELTFACAAQNTHRCSLCVLFALGFSWFEVINAEREAWAALLHLDRFEWSCDGYTLVEPKRITVVVCFIWVSSHVHTTAMEFDARRMYWNLQSATCAATLRLSL